MKKNYFGKSVLAGLAGVCLATICCTAVSHAATKKSDAPAQGSDGGGTFVINRNDSVGSGIDITIVIDGKRVSTLLRGMRYRGTLAPGKHTISLVPQPNLSGQGVAKTEITVEPGHNYSFSAARNKSGSIELVRNP